MAFWTYTRNKRPQDSFTSAGIQLDTMELLTLEMGHAYDLTPTELARARQFVEMEPGRAPVNVSPGAPGYEYPPYVPTGGAPIRETQAFFQPSPLIVGQGLNAFSFPSYRRLIGVKAVLSGPASSTMRIDLNRNGETIFINQAARPSINSGARHSPVAVPNVTDLQPEDELTVDIDEISLTDSSKTLLVVVEVASS
jgi:hypothetical protein